ncbi:hypothetical protein [Saccharopolyspora sp. ASAGF58]|nr:hypothetical protein [Saccharopolyspora sp. ASAGF58]
MVLVDLVGQSGAGPQPVQFGGVEGAQVPVDGRRFGFERLGRERRTVIK